MGSFAVYAFELRIASQTASVSLLCIGLEHGRKASFRVQVRGRGDSQAAGKGRGQVGLDISDGPHSIIVLCLERNHSLRERTNLARSKYYARGF